MPEENRSRPQESRQPYTDEEINNLLKGAVPKRRRHFTFGMTKFIFGALAQTVVMVLNVVMASTLYQQQAILNPFVIGLLVTAVLINIACVVAIFLWRRWGFYGLVAINVLVSIPNLCNSASVGRGFVGLLTIGALYWMLTRGGEESIWRHLK